MGNTFLLFIYGLLYIWWYHFLAIIKSALINMSVQVSLSRTYTFGSFPGVIYLEQRTVLLLSI